MYSFPSLEPVHFSMSSSNCCFLTFIQVSYEANKVVWYSILFKNFPQFVVIHIAKAFSVVSEADVFLAFSCFFCDPKNVGGLIPGLGRSPGEGRGNPLQYSCLENPMDRGAWWATVHGVTKSQTQPSMHIHTHISTVVTFYLTLGL